MKERRGNFPPSQTRINQEASDHLIKKPYRERPKKKKKKTIVLPKW